MLGLYAGENRTKAGSTMEGSSFKRLLSVSINIKSCIDLFFFGLLWAWLRYITVYELVMRRSAERIRCRELEVVKKVVVITLISVEYISA